jgi:transcriptional regulator with XRE-family HTH domain
MNPFANKITRHRKKLCFTKKTVANLVQCSETYIGNIENKGVVPEDEIVIRLANALSVDERELLLLAHKVKAPRGAKQYFEAPKASYPHVRRFLLERCSNREVMAEEFHRAPQSTLEKFVSRHILVEPLRVYSGLRSSPGQQVETLEYLFDRVLGTEPQDFPDCLLAYEREFAGPTNGNATRFLASVEDMVESWWFDTEKFKLSVESRHDFVRRKLSFARETLGQYVEYHRRKRDLTIEEVSRRAQIVPEALERIEQDEYPLELKLEIIGHILLALGIGQTPPVEEEKMSANDYRLLQIYKKLSDSSKKEIDSFMNYKLSEEDLADL